MLVFLKLGGSLITDKTGVEVVRRDVLTRVAAEIAAALADRPELKLVVGHGGGSFGHVAAAKHGTRQGVAGRAAWLGYAEVSDAMARLNGMVRGALRDAGVPAVTVQPSASVRCRDGQVELMSIEPISRLLDAGLVPVVHGDAVLDSVRGGTIVSTEEVLSFVAEYLTPKWLLLAGEVEGVLNTAGETIPLIDEANFAGIAPALGASRGTDVTGGMASKVRAMLDLVGARYGLAIRIFSGLPAGSIERALRRPETAPGTVVQR